MTETESTSPEKYNVIFARMLKAACSTIALGGLAIFGFQIWFWLTTGHWYEVPLSYLFYLIGPENLVAWLREPHSWVGLHMIVDWILDAFPLPFTLVLSGWIVAEWLDGLINDMQRQNN